MLLPLDQLLDAARSVGLDMLETTAEDANIYVWATPGRQVLYIGKQEHPGRAAEEVTWVKEGLDPRHVIVGFLALAHRFDAVQHCYSCPPLDRATARTAMAGWYGVEELQARLDSPDPWTTPETEDVLIRIAVNAGYPVANSAGAGMWASRMRTPTNLLAAVAVINHPVLGYEALAAARRPATT